MDERIEKAGEACQPPLVDYCFFFRRAMTRMAVAISLASSFKNCLLFTHIYLLGTFRQAQGGFLLSCVKTARKNEAGK